jgi:hypothetical protein
MPTCSCLYTPASILLPLYSCLYTPACILLPLYSCLYTNTSILLPLYSCLCGAVFMPLYSCLSKRSIMPLPRFLTRAPRSCRHLEKEMKEMPRRKGAAHATHATLAVAAAPVPAPAPAPVVCTNIGARNCTSASSASKQRQLPMLTASQR